MQRSLFAQLTLSSLQKPLIAMGSKAMRACMAHYCLYVCTVQYSINQSIVKLNISIEYDPNFKSDDLFPVLREFDFPLSPFGTFPYGTRNCMTSRPFWEVFLLGSISLLGQLYISPPSVSFPFGGLLAESLFFLSSTRNEQYIYHLPFYKQ